nr:response regulator [uncultured Methanospirillum sp.]
MIHILFVDDVPELLEIGKKFLEMNPGFIVDTTSSGKIALQLIQNITYDVIISDYSMPEMNGLEFLIQVRSINTFIPFIFFTSQDEEKLMLTLIGS